MLKVVGVDVYYGGSHVIRGISLDVGASSSVCVIGRNGAGKSTLLKAIAGLKHPTKGSVIYKGQNITNLPAYEIARLGLGYVPQDRAIFRDFTVQENLELGTQTRGRSKTEIPKEIFEYFPVLKERLSQKAGTLSGGQAKMLAIGRALAGKPDLLMLDEPTEGIQPSIVEEIEEIMCKLAARMPILLVEQNVQTVSAVGQTGYVIQKGEVVADGIVKELIESGTAHKYLAV